MLSALAGFSSLNAMLRIEEIKMQKILVEKDIDGKMLSGLGFQRKVHFITFSWMEDSIMQIKNYTERFWR